MSLSVYVHAQVYLFIPTCISVILFCSNRYTNATTNQSCDHLHSTHKRLEVTVTLADAVGLLLQYC